MILIFVLFSGRICVKTDTFIIEGITVEQDLVPFITSDIGVYGK